MTETEHGDVIWKQALDWIMREHEEPFDAAARTALRDWLAETPAHRQAYDQARTLWLITRMVPTADEQSDPPSGEG